MSFRTTHSLPRTAGAVFLLLLASAAVASPADWPTAMGDSAGTRYSEVNQITPANVSQLKPVWVYHMKPAASSVAGETAADVAQAQAEQAGAGAYPARNPSEARRYTASESIPLVVKGVMYMATPYSRIVALDGATGKQLWVHQLAGGVQPATRGMEYWPGNHHAATSLIFGTSDGKLLSIRASDGTPMPGFGDNGVVDLRTPDVMVGGMNKPYRLTSPPIVYGDVVITGSAVGEANGGSRGDVRAWDAATGKLRWTFRSVPGPGEPGYETWGNDSGKNRSGVNVWGFMTVDKDRGIVYMPFGAPTNDRIGVDRPGDNLYGTSIVAVAAATGKYLWHFQVVHHDIWDNDTESPPVLFNVVHGGMKIPAVGVVSKNGLLFILNRLTGKPIYPVEERPVPASDVPGEQASPTQPFPATPPPLARMSLKPSELSKITPEHEEFCRKLVADNNIAMGGPYNPPTYQRPMVYFPGTLGGVNWNGGAFDPKRGLFVVNVFQLGQIMEIVPDGHGGFVNRGPLNGRFWDPKTRLPCQEGPWGELVAVDVNTGKIAWRSVLGVSDNLPAAKQLTGRPSTGGPVVTAGGLTFVGGTDDARFRAFDTATGKELWTYRLPASAHTNPITYSVAGRQYVAIVSAGGSFLGSPVVSDQLTVFAVK